MAQNSGVASGPTVHPLVDLGAEAADLALGHAAGAHRLDQIIDRARRDPMDVGFLDHRHEGLLRRPARFQEAGEVAALAQLRDLQRDPARPGIPVAVAVAVALNLPHRRSRALGRARPGLNLGVHDPLRREGQHLAHEITISLLLNQLDQRHSLFGQVGLADARRAQEQDGLAIGDEPPRRQIPDLASIHRRLGGEVEAGQVAAEGEAGEAEAHLDATLILAGDLALAEQGQGLADRQLAPARLVDQAVDLIADRRQLQLTYVSKGLLLEQEKNVSAPLPNGPSAGATDTAKPARKPAKTARRG